MITEFCCCGNFHDFRKCESFIKRKRLCSTNSYLSGDLLDVDKAGFCAAGVLFITPDDKICVIIDKKKKGIPSGKREAVIKKQFIFLESFRDTAIRETREELVTRKDVLDQLEKKIRESKCCYWLGKYYYVMIVVEVEEPFELENGEWVSIESVNSDDFHSHVYKSIKGFRKKLAELVHQETEEELSQILEEETCETLD
ncbi:MAG: hypothetical protein KatS3mg101_0823 [Patescibacteria group bacterium]|nr:MAG: hypothetical protein KatS3mg101_0823 [Patescibacteria group bacterium]